MTVPGELARVTGLPRPDAGRGNRALVAEGYATMPARGEYWLVNRAESPTAQYRCSGPAAVVRAARRTCTCARAHAARARSGTLHRSTQHVARDRLLLDAFGPGDRADPHL